MAATSSMVLTGANTVSQFAASRQQAGAVLAQGTYNKRLDDFNAHIAQLQAQDAIQRGQRDEAIQRQRTGQLIGAQRAGMAAGGVDVNDGSAIDVQADTARIGELDALTIRNNAAREAFGYQVQSSNYTRQGQLALAAAENTSSALKSQSWGTLLTGTSQMLGQYMGMKRDAKAKPPKGGGR